LRKVIHLSPGECRVLACLTDERTFKTIAADLDVSINTAKTLALRAYRELGVNDRHAAVEAHRRFRRRGHYCEHLRVRDSLVTGWEFRHQAVT
jgi:DNA-binding CsgD family transcriptional regulator